MSDVRPSTSNDAAPAEHDEAGQDQVALDPSLQDHIGRQLRVLYDDVVHQPIPDRFLQLLEELERKTSGKSANTP